MFLNLVPGIPAHKRGIYLYIMVTVILTLLTVTFPTNTTAAQSNASVAVAVEIIAPSLTLSVSSARLDFGQISQDSGPVELHPESGSRSGDAYSTYSLAGILLTGPPGMQVTVHVQPPVFPTNSGPHPIFQHTWAHSHECANTGFVRLPDATTLQEEIGPSGCTQIQFGGVLTANQAPQGLYEGAMTIQITQL